MAAVGFFLLPEWLRKRSSTNDNVEELEVNMATATATRKDYQLLPEEAEEDNYTDTDGSILTQNVNNVKSAPKEVVNYKMIIAASFLDVIANFALTIGFFYVGSGMYQVIYSSVVIWCAILSFFLLGRKLSLLQSVSIVGVSVGLALSAFGINQISDRILSACTPDTRPPSPEKVCFLVGTNMFASFIHNLAYYWLMKELGNVSTGILNSLRAIVVFGLSHFMFCHIDEGQCFNIWKGWSAIIVVGFVTIFSISKSKE
ncbi:10176_t:CDS:2 [Funneliformis geosporum]|uniref:10176_t:CDS:1 n=1 Tax=Funneliformis geosporum TaxID=1117311 RepID=A0A9W4SUL9_9GLOM|nr:10176_t:CDS:2 [Funneliformis geosporum]